MRPEDKNINKKDGDRVYAGYNNKEPFSHSVSPHSKEFLSSLEPGIKDIVLTLRSKMYWTLSSCQGHTFKDSRNFTCAFRTRKEARAFMALVNHHVKGLTTLLNNPEHYMQYEIIEDEDGDVELEKREGNTREMAVHSLNKLFRTNYNDFHLVEVRITDYIYSDDSLFTKFKKSVDRMVNKEKRTEALLKYLRNDIEYYWH